MLKTFSVKKIIPQTDFTRNKEKAGLGKIQLRSSSSQFNSILRSATVRRLAKIAAGAVAGRCAFKRWM